MKTTKHGISYVSLNNADEDYDIEDMMTQAIAGFLPFDFSQSIEVLVFYTERDDFGEYVDTAFSIQDDAYEDSRVSHYSYENKSIIGVELAGLETIPMITYGLGKSIELHRNHLDKEHAQSRSLKPGYTYWSEFFAQTKASLNRKSGSLYLDCPMNMFEEMLVYKEDLFQKSEMDVTFFQLITAFSDMTYQEKITGGQAVVRFYETVEKRASRDFAELVVGFYRFLNNYMVKAGEFYTAPHDDKVFDEIEIYKTRMTNYFN